MEKERFGLGVADYVVSGEGGVRGFREWFESLAAQVRCRINEVILLRYRNVKGDKPLLIVCSGHVFFGTMDNCTVDGYHFARGDNNIDIYRLADYLRDLGRLAILLKGPTALRFWTDLQPLSTGGPYMGPRLVDIPEIGFFAKFRHSCLALRLHTRRSTRNHV